jgi:hypothetical protein
VKRTTLPEVKMTVRETLHTACQDTKSMIFHKAEWLTLSCDPVRV